MEEEEKGVIIHIIVQGGGERWRGEERRRDK